MQSLFHCIHPKPLSYKERKGQFNFFKVTWGTYFAEKCIFQEHFLSGVVFIHDRT